MPQFAANISTLYQELPFLDRIQAAADDGFDAVECQLPYALPAEVIAAKLHACRLPMVLINAPTGGTDAASIEAAWHVQGLRGLAALPEYEAEFKESIAVALQYTQVLNCPRMHVMAGLLPAAQPHLPPQLIRQTYVRNLRWAGEQAAQHGVDVLIEPINGRRDMPGYVLQHQADAHAVLDAVNLPNVRLQLDFYHCQIMDGDLVAHLRQAMERDRLGHVQIAGAANRNEPNMGEVHYPHVLACLDQLSAAFPQVNWSNYVGCEYKPAKGAVPYGTRDGLDWLRQARADAASTQPFAHV